MGSKVTQRGGAPSRLACNSMLSPSRVPSLSQHPCLRLSLCLSAVNLGQTLTLILCSDPVSPSLCFSVSVSPAPAPSCAPARPSHPLSSFSISPTPCSPFSFPLSPSPSLSVSPSLCLPGICLVSSINNIWAIDHPGHRGGREAAVEERASSCHKDWVEVGVGATPPVLRKDI